MSPTELRTQYALGKWLLLILCGCLGSLVSCVETQGPDFKIGLIADCQYADLAPRDERVYRRCPDKIRSAVAVLNDSELHHIVHLGDYIEENWNSFGVMEDAVKALKVPLRHVLGNHDFSVADRFKAQVPRRMNLSSRYYSETLAGWRFIYLDGNDVSLHAWPKSSPQDRASVRAYETHYKNHKPWNGALSREQLLWLEKQLQAASLAGEKVVLFCHFQLLPSDNHSLWNSAAVVALLEKYPAVKAWVNGHQHSGDYVVNNKIHYLTLKAMLDTQDTAFSEMWFYQNRIELIGHGRQPSLTLSL